MKYILLFICCTFALSASAQWWHINLHFKKHPVYSLIRPVKDNSITRLAVHRPKLNTPEIKTLDLGQSQFSLQLAEASMLKIAKHNMRFRVYNEASYNFSDLAQIYIQMNRLSEAKWYLLQSNNLSREQNDDKHTIANLIKLAMVKTNIGDVSSAHADLLEAREMARARGLQITAVEIESKIQAMERNTAPVTRADLKYAESTGNEKKAL